MLNRRLQILLDEERYLGLEAEAEERGTSVAAVVRDAIDRLLTQRQTVRREAGERLLSAEPMAVDDWEVLKEDLLELGARGT